jgi:hypothetical protein
VNIDLNTAGTTSTAGNYHPQAEKATDRMELIAPAISLLTATEIDRCLPGPTSCDMTYAGPGCLIEHLAFNGDFDPSCATTYCCPEFVTA